MAGIHGFLDVLLVVTLLCTYTWGCPTLASTTDAPDTTVKSISTTVKSTSTTDEITSTTEEITSTTEESTSTETLNKTRKILIAAFNIENFGPKTANDPDQMKHIVKIIRRYDIIVIQEVTDKTEVVLPKLLKKINKVKGPKYKHCPSERLGCGRRKEQYVYFYRDEPWLHLIDKFTYEEGENDIFLREPFVAFFKFDDAVEEMQNLALVPLHANPNDEDTLDEINALVTVQKTAVQKFTNKYPGKKVNVLILGDLNADTPSVKNADLDGSLLKKDKETYDWPIDHNVDTMATCSVKAYDRFVVVGKTLKAHISKKNPGKPFNFEIGCKIDHKLATRISNHYPIEIGLDLN